MPSLDFDAIKRDIPMDDVLFLLDWHWVWARAPVKRGPCPVHKSSTVQSRSLVITDQVWYCHKCKRGGDVLELYAQVVGKPIYEATLELCARLGRHAYCLRRPLLRGRSRNSEEAL